MARAQCPLALLSGLLLLPVLQLLHCVPTGIRNQEFPQGFYSESGTFGPCQVRFRNSRFQELPRGVPWLWYFPVRSGGSRNKIVARTGMRPRNDPFLAPHNPRSLSLWQIFNGIEQNEKMKSCGQKYWDSGTVAVGQWDSTPSKILAHFGLQSTRETAAKSVTGARVSLSC